MRKIGFGLAKNGFSFIFTNAVNQNTFDRNEILQQ